MTYKPTPSVNREVKPGTTVRCLRRVNFADGTYHEKNDILVVTETTLAYYSRFTDNRSYEVWM